MRSKPVNALTITDVTIGNDIVDLREEEPSLHPRYIDRVFTRTEQSNFGSDTIKMWLNWSAKEAAYKAISRILPETTFSPIDFELISDELIRFKEHLLHYRSILNDHYVFSYCSSCKETLNSAMINWIKEIPEQINSNEHSIRIRDFVKNKLSEFYGIAKSELNIPFLSKPNAAPSAYVEDKPIRGKLSFTHHGRFLACSFVDL